MNEFIIYANIEQGGWKELKRTPSRDNLEHILRTIKGATENVSVIVVYSMSDRDIPLCSFNNKVVKELDFKTMLRWSK